MRGLVYIGKVIQILPIEEADCIESLTVIAGKGGKWRGCATKNQFKENDNCLIFLQDSLLPQTPEFEFMKKYNYRVRMMRFKGVPSEVLIMPQTIPGCIGDDVTLEAKVEKYNKPVPEDGQTFGNFPSFIPKTDEPNVQKVWYMLKQLQGVKCYSTTKIDGTSITIYNWEDHIGCCSRNWEKQHADNPIWKIAEKYGLIEEHTINGFALQMELAGPGIQKNPLGLKEITPFLFNVYNIKEQRYENGDKVKETSNILGIPMVPIQDWGFELMFKTIDELQKYTEGVYPNGKQREGIVIRPMEEMYIDNERLSFKVINLLYKE